MTIYTPAYRATVYGPRSADPTEATVLTPVAGAAHSDSFQITTLPALAGWKPYMEAPRGRRGSIDLRTKRVTVGEMAFRVLDVKAGASGGNAVRWVTAFLGDLKGTARLTSLKVYVEESLDGGATWASFFTGRLKNLRLNGSKLWFDVIVRDTARELARLQYRGVPHSSISYASPLSVFPVGPAVTYGTWSAVAPATGTVAVNGVDAGGRGLRINLDGATRGRYDCIITSAFWDAAAYGYALYTSQVTADPPAPLGWGLNVPYGARPVGRVKIKNLTSGHSGAFYLVQVTPTAGFLYHAGTGHWTAAYLLLAPVPTTDPEFLAVSDFAAGNGVELRVLLDGPAGPGALVLVSDVHPFQWLKDGLDGKFASLWAPGETRPAGKNPGDVKWAFPYLASSGDPESGGRPGFNDFIADTTYPPLRLVVDASMKMSDALEKIVCPAWQACYRIDGRGRVVPIDVRAPTTLPVTTITDADLTDTKQNLSWEPDADNAVTRVDAKRYVDRPTLDVGVLWTQGAEYPTIDAHLIEQSDVPVIILDVGPYDLDEQIFPLDAPGFRSVAGELYQNVTRDAYLDAALRDFALGLRRPFGTGAVTITAQCRRTANTSDCQPGDLRLLTITTLPDPTSFTRGGTRVARCVGREEQGLTVALTFLDLGINATAVVPTLGAPAQESTNTQHGATITVTLNAAGDPAVLAYAVTDTGTGSAPAAGSGAWVPAVRATATGAVTVRGLPGGRRIWFRARTDPDVKAGPRYNFPSAWVVSASVDLAALATPGVPTTSLLTNTSVRITFTPGDLNLRTEVLLSQPNGGTLARILSLPAGQGVFDLYGLDAATGYGLSLQHVDDVGGVSPRSAVAGGFTTSGTSAKAPNMGSVAVISALA